MGTREPVLIDSGGGSFPFGILLFFVIIGIIGIVVWLTWMLAKSKNKSTTDVVKVPASPAPVQALENYLLSLRRTITGEWEIQVNGQRYRSLEAVPDDAVRKEVVTGLKELASFARSYIQKGQPSSQKPSAPQLKPQQVAPAPPSPIIPPADAPSITPAVAPTLKLSSESRPSSMPRVSLYGEPQLKRSSVAPTLMPTIDLAKEIGDIVEEMHTHDPKLRERSIRLRNAPTGGVEFAIDGIVYAAVDEIPDSDVQALIRAATKEWERR